MASTLFSAPSFQGLKLLNKSTDSVTITSAAFCRPIASKKHANTLIVKAKFNTSLVISLSTKLSLFLGRFVFFNFQRENMVKQGLSEHNGVLYFESGDVRTKEYVSLLKSNDPVGFNIVDVLVWGSVGHMWLIIFLSHLAMAMIPSSFDI